MSIINWNSKKQSTIERLVFDAEFLAIKVCVDTLCAIQYNWKITGIATSGPTYNHRDSMLVTHNTSKPESTLKKKFNAVAYHVIYESVAMKE